jgi:hypothetical protein
MSVECVSLNLINNYIRSYDVYESARLARRF